MNAPMKNDESEENVDQAQTQQKKPTYNVPFTPNF